MIGQPPWRVGISAAFWGNPSRRRLRPWLATVAEMGFEGVTLFADFWVWPDAIGDGKAARRAIHQAGLELASLVTRVDDDLERYRRLASAVAVMGGQHLVLIGGDGRGPGAVAVLGARLDRIGRVTAAEAVRTSYHHHTDTAVESFAEVSDLLAQTDPAVVSLAFDVGHATKDFSDLPIGDRATRSLEALWPRVAIVELKDWRPGSDLDTPVGDGLADAGAVLDRLAERRYGDWLVVEQNDDLGRSATTKKECARRSLAFIRSHGGAAFNAPASTRAS